MSGQRAAPVRRRAAQPTVEAEAAPPEQMKQLPYQAAPAAVHRTEARHRVVPVVVVVVQEMVHKTVAMEQVVAVPPPAAAVVVVRAASIPATVAPVALLRVLRVVVVVVVETLRSRTPATAVLQVPQVRAAVAVAREPPTPVFLQAATDQVQQVQPEAMAVQVAHQPAPAAAAARVRWPGVRSVLQAARTVQRQQEVLQQVVPAEPVDR